MASKRTLKRRLKRARDDLRDTHKELTWADDYWANIVETLLADAARVRTAYEALAAYTYDALAAKGDDLK